MIQTFEFHPIFVLSGNTVWLAKNLIKFGPLKI